MKHATLKIAASALGLMAAQVLAQTGEAGATMELPAAKKSPEEIAATRDARRQEAVEAARMSMTGETGGTGIGDTAAPMKATPQERAQVASRRRADALAAYKNGDVHGGEASP